MSGTAGSDRHPRGRAVGRDSLVATAAYQPEPEAVASARHFVRETLQAWQGSGHCAGHDDLVEDAVLLTSELVTNAVVHARTSVQVMCRLADESVEIAVVDHRPVQLIPDQLQDEVIQAERTNGRGLRLPAELASAWGVTYARTCKAVWFRMGVPDSAWPGNARTGPGVDELELGRQELELGRRKLERGRRERVRFLAEAGDLLAVSLDTEKILVLGAQLAIAHFAAWCAVLLADGDAAPRLAHVAHTEPSRTAALDWLLRRCGAGAAQEAAAALPWQLPLSAGTLEMPPGAAELATDQAWCFPLVTASRKLGLLVFGGPGMGGSSGGGTGAGRPGTVGSGTVGLADEVAEVAEGLARRIAVALDNCGPQSWQELSPAERGSLPACR